MDPKPITINPDNPILALIPEKLRTSYRSGAIELLSDGELQYTALSPKHPGGIAGFLQPAADSTGNLVPGVPITSSLGQLSEITGLLQFAVGLQVVNLAVSAVGFAIVNKKLNQIMESLKNIDQKLDKIHGDIARVERILGYKIEEGFLEIGERLNLQLVARVKGSSKTLEQASSSGRISLVDNIITDVNQCIEESKLCCLDSISRKKADKSFQLYLLYVNSLILMSNAWIFAENPAPAVEQLEDELQTVNELSRDISSMFLSKRPSIYIQDFTDREDEEIARIAIDGIIPINTDDGINYIKKRYPAGEKDIGRTNDFGDQEIHIPFEGIYIPVPHLIPEEIFNIFKANRNKSLMLAAQTSTARDMLERQCKICKTLLENKISIKECGKHKIGHFEIVDLYQS